MDVAVLGLEAHSEPIRDATRDLDRLTGSAKKAEGATKSLASGSQQAAGSKKTLSSASALVTTRMNVESAAIRANNVALKVTARSAGAAAFAKRQLAVQGLDVAQTLALGIPVQQVLLQQGGQIAGIYAGQGGMTQAFKDAAGSFGSMIARFPAISAAAALLTAGIAGMTYEINRASDVSVSFGNTAVGAFRVVKNAIVGVLQPAVAAISPWFEAAYQGVKSATKTVVNLIINSFRAAFVDIKFLWDQLPNALGAAMIGAANAVIAGLNKMLDKAAQGIDWLIDKINTIPGVDISKIGATSPLDLLDNSFAADLGAAVQVRNNTIDDIMGSDPIGKFFDAVQSEAVKAALEGVEDAAGKAGKAVKDAGEKGKDAWKGLRKVTNDVMQKMRDASNQLGQSAGEVLSGLINKTTSWKDAAISAIKSIIVYLNQMNVAKGGAGLFGGGFLQSLIGGFLGIGFAKGGVFNNGQVQAFAQGGIVNGPTVFPMAKGMGLMGEAGPEAVMPLQRGPDGRLGVSMHGANSNRPQVVRLHVVGEEGPMFRPTIRAESKGVAVQVSDERTAALATATPMISQQTTRNANLRNVQPVRRIV